MGQTVWLVIQIAVGLVLLTVAVWFGAVLFLLVLGLVAVVFILHWLRLKGIIGSGKPNTSFTYQHDEFRSDDEGEQHITVIETEYHEVKDDPHLNPPSEGGGSER